MRKVTRTKRKLERTFPITLDDHTAGQLDDLRYERGGTPSSIMIKAIKALLYVSRTPQSEHERRLVRGIQIFSKGLVELDADRRAIYNAENRRGHVD